MSTELKVAYAAIAPVAAQWLATVSAYWAGTIASHWPWALFTLLFIPATGAYALWSVGKWSAKTRAVTVVVYVPVALLAQYFVGLFTACSFGDCL